MNKVQRKTMVHAIIQRAIESDQSDSNPLTEKMLNFPEMRAYLGRCLDNWQVWCKEHHSVSTRQVRVELFQHVFEDRYLYNAMLYGVYPPGELCRTVHSEEPFTVGVIYRTMDHGRYMVTSIRDLVKERDGSPCLETTTIMDAQFILEGV